MYARAKLISALGLVSGVREDKVTAMYL